MASESTAPLNELLLAYLPRTLLERWSREPGAADTWHETLRGSLMLCDMSGFTAMSERLARLGNEGAEVMASVLNRFFDRMLRIADGWGGVQMKFGGDAMLLFFGQGDHAARAAACALEMQRAMPEFRNIAAGGEQHRLRMRVGIHSGEFLSASVGDEGGALHYVLTGPDVNGTAHVEGVAQPRQVVCSAATGALLAQNGAKLIPVADGCFRVTHIEPPARAYDAPRISNAPPDVLPRYLLPALAAPLARGAPPNLVTEHRRVTAVFINVFGIADLLRTRGPDEAVSQVNQYVRLVLAGLSRHEGSLGGSDAADKGDKLIALFGAPVAAVGQEAKAVRFALELVDSLAESGLDLTHRIGISTGFVFAGEIGSPIRREYTVIGDSVNLAARLMTAARPGEVYVSTPTAERAGEAFDFRRLRPLALKGKAAPVRAFRASGLKTQEAPRASASARSIVGRQAELRALDELASGAQIGGHWAHIAGEPGIGKSALTGALCQRLSASGWRTVTSAAQAHLAGTPFALWGPPLRELLGIAPADHGDDAWRHLRGEVDRLALPRAELAPLIADALAIPAPPEPMIEFLDAKARRQLLSTLVRDLVRAYVAERPLCLVMDDAHESDGASLELLAELLEARIPGLFVCVSSRLDDLPVLLAGAKPDLSLYLTELSEQDARELVAALGDIPEGQRDAVVARAQGNPLFLEELARAPESANQMPQTVDEVILSRLDHLPVDEKVVLRAAAAVGASFSQAHIQSLVSAELAPDEALAALERLQDSGFVTHRPQEFSTHAFTHVLTQEVVYGTLPFARRRELHHAVGVEIERESADRLPVVCGVLLHHFDRAGDVPRTRRYATMTGDRAAGVFANREAIGHYERAMEAAQRGHRDAAADRSMLLERIGECLDIEGRHGAAAEAFRDALDAWRRRGRRKPSVPPMSPSPPAAREAALSRKVAVAFERNSDYDESLRWLDRALTALPPRATALRSEVFASRSMALFRKGMYRDAIEWGRNAVRIARQTRDPRRVAYAQNMLGNSYIEEGQLRHAVRHLEPAVELYDRIDDVYGQAASNNNLGNCFQALGDLPAALNHYRVALRADERMGKNGAIIHNNLGEVLLMMGNADEAADHLEQVVRANEADANLNAVAGLSQVNLSRCRVLQGDLNAAEQHLQKGLRLLRGVGARGLLAEARRQAAELRLAQGRPQPALREALAALDEAKALDARLLEASAERVVACAYAALNNFDAAWAHATISVALAARAQAEHERARSAIALAEISATSGRPLTRSTISGLRRAASVLTRMGAQRDAAEAQRLLSETDGIAAA